MGRSTRPEKSSRKPHVKSRKANALGYAKRQTLKSKKSPGGTGVSDVYEYQQESVRRGKVKLELEKDEMVGGRGGFSGSEEEEEEGTSRSGLRRPRLVGENDDDNEIGEDEDEDIDSDGAFDESDEERFAGFSFSQKKKKTSTSKPKGKSASVPTRGVRFEVDLNEDEDEALGLDESSQSGSSDEDEEMEGDSDEFIDVLDIMDGKGEPVSEDNTGDIEQGANSEDDITSASEAEEEAASALQDLESFITNLEPGHKRKTLVDEDDTEVLSGEPKRQKRRMLKERTHAGTESEFAAYTGASKLKLDDLLAPLTTSSTNLISLKKSAKILASTSTKNQTLSAPLPQRTQERLDREAAYEQTKEEVDKWSGTMKRIREAEHLSFPLQTQPTGKTSNLELAAKFKPTTELESAVDKLLKSAKMREQDIAQTETLKMNHLSIEEVAARRAELAKIRELMFRAEVKAKRVAKIKSKTYRRIKKKEKAKLAAKLGEDDEDDGDLDDEGRLKREVARAKERATLRHKNTGKWAKAMKARGELDGDQRRDIGEMLDRGEKLRRRIRGEGSGGESGDDDDDSDDEDGEDVINRIKTSAFEELSGLDKGDDLDPGVGGGKGKSIFEMKFMKNAMERDRRRADHMADDFIKELGIQRSDGEGDEDNLHNLGSEHTEDASVERVGGRVIYRPGASSGQLRTVGSLSSDTSSVTLKSTDFPPDFAHPTSPTLTSPLTGCSVPLLPEETSNPWLVPQDQSGSKPVQKKHEVAIGKDSGAAEKSKNRLKKRHKKHDEEKEKSKEDATVDISISNVMTLSISGTPAGPAEGSSIQAGAKLRTNKTSGTPQALAEGDDDSDANSEVEEQERALSRKGKGKAKGMKAFEQRDLVARAFAGDNVVQDFAEAKRREMAEDAPKELDTTLPGWGSWGGAGAKRAPPKPHLIKKIAGVDPKSRADYNKAHVIISEKRDKKAAKYLVKDLPYPYTSKAQFERSMDTPLGTEWNTRVGFQRGTLPKVVMKMGTVISPLEKLQ